MLFQKYEAGEKTYNMKILFYCGLTANEVLFQKYVANNKRAYNMKIS